MDLENQKRVKEFAEEYGPENVVVMLGAAEGEAAGLAAETVTAGDPTYAGPLTGVQLGLRVYHACEPEVKEDGTVTYKHICNLKPKSNEIWNNKFEAANVDGTDKNTKLTATTFIKQGGGEISDMMMVREVYKK